MLSWSYMISWLAGARQLDVAAIVGEMQNVLPELITPVQTLAASSSPRALCRIPVDAIVSHSARRSFRRHLVFCVVRAGQVRLDAGNIRHQRRQHLQRQFVCPAGGDLMPASQLRQRPAAAAPSGSLAASIRRKNSAPLPALAAPAIYAGGGTARPYGAPVASTSAGIRNGAALQPRYSRAKWRFSHAQRAAVNIVLAPFVGAPR